MQLDTSRKRWVKRLVCARSCLEYFLISLHPPPLFHGLRTCFIEQENKDKTQFETLQKHFGGTMGARTRVCLGTFLYISAFSLVPKSENLILLEDAEGLVSELSQGFCSFALLNLTRDVS